MEKASSIASASFALAQKSLKHILFCEYVEVGGVGEKTFLNSYKSNTSEHDLYGLGFACCANAAFVIL